MGYEFTCHGCQKRYPGCHGFCEDYKKDKARYDAQKAMTDKERAVKAGLLSQRDDAVAMARKKRRGQHG